MHLRGTTLADAVVSIGSCCLGEAMRLSISYSFVAARLGLVPSQLFGGKKARPFWPHKQAGNNLLRGLHGIRSCLMTSTNGRIALVLIDALRPVTHISKVTITLGATATYHRRISGFQSPKWTKSFAALGLASSKGANHHHRCPPRPGAGLIHAALGSRNPNDQVPLLPHTSRQPANK